MLFKNSIFSIIVKFIKCKTPWEKFIYFCLPILVGFCYFIVAKYTKINYCCNFDFCNFTIQLSNTLILITSLFITSSIIYMVLIAGGGTEGVYYLRKETSEKYSVKRWHNDHFQTLLLDIAYTVILGILFLCFLLLVKFLVVISTVYAIKVYIGITIIIFTHLTFVTLGNVKDIYFTIR